MKIDLSVTVTSEILSAILPPKESGQPLSAASFGHIGTHFDVMDKTFSLDNTERQGKIFNVSGIGDREITLADIDPAVIAAGDFVIFYTGCLQAQKYGSPDYFANHPELATALITALVDKKVSMIGIDAAGVRRGAGHREADTYCAAHDIFIVENLDNLDRLWQAAGTRPFLVHTYPVKYAGLTGLPCRVVAEV